MSSDVYTRVSEKMKQEHFTEEQIKIVGKAKEQLSTYTTGGSVIGGLSGLTLARAKNFKGLPAMAIITGCFFIGSQLGLVMGAMSSIKTIQSIPNFERVLNIVQEVRDEASRVGERRGPSQHDRAAAFPSAGIQRFPTQQNRSELMTDFAVEQQSQQFEGFRDGDGYHGGDDPTGQLRVDQSSAWSQAPQRAKELQNHSNSWNQIRQQNMPKSAWNDIRNGNRRSTTASDEIDEEDASGYSSNPDSKKASSVKPALTGWDRVRHGDADGFMNNGVAYDGPSDFARTREDLESRPSRQKNQYGDML
ncbi:hypothetical protein BGZ80_002739 [Entomortierella chlamydospora]|uniref:Uncharacterized protein n=1 Tax=Entomortierella chlamydospora TaxID=101097 RepID=A0A9P6T325_9FUNG|nr:hypothetical protein BGZ79_000664 [Entomortierella chlamydospora]KAG0021270.1 hypothetical protein BGZ80_002739 [Entomortierella chlamydospora]